jgi:hypothetical protein
MRILEIAVLVLLMIMIIWSLRRNATKSIPYAAASAFSFLTIILHLLIEGWRWQMVPAYGVGAVVLILTGIRFLKHQADNRPQTKGRRMRDMGTFQIVQYGARLRRAERLGLGKSTAIR